jgi:hypothetical protein
LFALKKYLADHAIQEDDEAHMASSLVDRCTSPRVKSKTTGREQSTSAPHPEADFYGSIGDVRKVPILLQKSVEIDDEP